MHATTRRLLPLTKEDDEPKVLKDKSNKSFFFCRLSTQRPGAN